MKIPICKNSLLREILKFPKETIFHCKLEEGIYVNGNLGYVETYFVDEKPIFELHVANNHSFSKGYLYV